MTPTKVPACPDCAGQMAKRSGPRGEFWGCRSFPACRGTRKVGEEDRVVEPKRAPYQPIVQMAGSDEQEAIWEHMLRGASHMVVNAGPGCLAGNTLIDCPRDLEKYPAGIPIRDLVGKTPYVYGYDVRKRRVVVRRAEKVWKTGERVPVFKVTFRSAYSPARNLSVERPPLTVVGTADHPFLLRAIPRDARPGWNAKPPIPGGWRKLADLKPGDRVVALLRQRCKEESILNLNDGTSEIESRFILSEIEGARSAEYHAHHKNKRHSDNSPDNLEWKTKFDHHSEHLKDRRAAGEKTGWEKTGVHPRGMNGKAQTEKQRRTASLTHKGVKKSAQHVASMKRSRWDNLPKYERSLQAKASATKLTQKERSAKARRAWETMRESGKTPERKASAKLGWETRRRNAALVTNHIVVKVEFFGYEDVYNMTVEECHNFVANGVVTHNTGKTFTMIQGCLRLPKSARVLFVAFNKHIAAEANGKLAASGCSNVRASTYHSWGYRVLRDAFPALREPDQEKSRKILEALSPAPLYGKREWRLALNLAEKLAGLCKNYLIDPRGPTFAADVDRIVDHHVLDAAPGVVRNALGLVGPAMEEAKRLASSSVDYDDMIWLPVALDLAPSYSADVVITDESQDLNAVQHELTFKMARSSARTWAKDGGRIVVVGDRHQCQPKGTLVYKTGAGYVPIETIKAGDQLATYVSGDIAGRVSQGRAVLEVASRQYCGRVLTVAAGSYKHECTPEHRCLFRMERRNGWALYVMRQGKHARVGVTKSQKNPAQSVALRALQERADAAWILNIFDNREDAMLAEAKIAYRYRLPQIIFSRKWSESKGVHTQGWLDTFWEHFPENMTELEECLLHHERLFEFPFWKKSKNGGERGRKHGSLYTSVTQACNLISGWMRVCTSDMRRRAVSNSDWKPVSVSSHHYQGRVYSLRLEDRKAGHPTYVAQGIVTHNSIYGFRGASTESIETMTERLRDTRLGVREFPLTITRRCPKMHVHLARCLFPDDIRALDDAPMGEMLQLHKDAAVEMMAPGDLVLCRVNKELIGTAYALIRRGVRPVVKGRDIGKGLTQLLDLLEKMLGEEPMYAISSRREGESAEASQVRALRSALQDYRIAKERELIPLGDRAAGRLGALHDKVECMEEFLSNSKSTLEARARIETLFSDEDNPSAVTLGTVHRTKGLEAERVFVLAPELIPHPMARREWEKEQEVHLAWVACTRAKFTRDAPGTLVFCGAIPAIYSPKAPLPPLLPEEKYPPADGAREEDEEDLLAACLASQGVSREDFEREQAKEMARHDGDAERGEDDEPPF